MLTNDDILKIVVENNEFSKRIRNQVLIYIILL